MPGGGRRKFKKERRLRMNAEQSISAMMNICRANGIVVTTPQELPSVLSAALAELANNGVQLEAEEETSDPMTLIPDSQFVLEEGQNGQEGSGEEVAGNEEVPEGESEEDLLLEEGIDLGLSDPEPEPEAIEVPIAPNVDWNPKVEDLFAQRRPPVAPKPTAPVTPKGVAPKAPAPAPKPALKPGQVDPSMVEAFKQKNAEMVARVGQSGVRYRNSPGPAAGQKMSPHPSVADRVMKAKQQQLPKKTPTPRAPEESGEEEVVAGPNDGWMNPKTGMSLQEQRQIIERATGKRPAPAKMGMPNMLKS